MPTHASLLSSQMRLINVRGYLLTGLMLGLVYAVWVLAVSPHHEFPLNDDWAYAQTVRHWMATGELRLSEWSSATLIFQVYWGGLFARQFGGFSFTALRWSTIAISFLGCLALYDLLRQLEIRSADALLGVLAVAANPIFVYLSYTFMSDLFFFGLMLASLALYVRGLKGGSVWALLAGSVLASAAFLSRQLGITLPLAAMAILVIQNRRVRLKPLLLAGLLPLGVVALHTFWLVRIHGIPWGMELNAIQNGWRVLAQPTGPLNLIMRLLYGMLYLGVFTLPVLMGRVFGLAVDRSRLVRLGKVFGVWLTMLGTLVIAITVLTGQSMPYLSNVINRDGIGTLTLEGVKTPVTPGWVFWLVTALAPIAGATQGTLWTEAFLHARKEFGRPSGALLLASLLMAGLTSLVPYMWDEYLIVFIPAGLYLGLRLGPLELRGRAIGVAACVLMLGYSLFEMDDHMAWNAARWTAGERIMARGVPPEAIDGGFEWIGWYEFRSALPQAIRNGQEDDLFAWMHQTPDRYTLAFEPLEGRKVVDRVSYVTPLLSRTGEIYVLESPAP